jgi:autotransporter-associated beta strand protein
MKTNKPDIQHSGSFATRFPVPTSTAPWRRSAFLATLALGLGGIISTAHATLLVYEGFDYAAPASGAQLTSANLTTLNGQTVSVATGNNPTGLTGAWTAGHTNTTPYASPYGFAICNNTFQTIWNGTSTSLTQTGKFAGSPAPVMAGGSLNGNTPDHMYAHRSIDPSVTATFTVGATTWMCFEQCTNFKANANGLGACFAIGSSFNFGTGATNNRGQSTYGGGAIGIGLGLDHYFKAAAWGDGLAAGALAGTNAVAGDPTTAANGGTGPASVSGYYPTSGTTMPKICIAKIIWGDPSTPTTVKLAVFNEGAALSTLNEIGFDNVAVSFTTTGNPDPLTYNTIALGGTRYNVDELRIGTTLNDAIGVVISSTGNYWAPEVTGGGSGTWSASSSVWATAPGVAGTGGQATTGTLVFGNAAGTVTIDGTVSTVAGLNFLSTYSLIPGASSPNLSLTGVDAAANTISVDSGKTATISADVTGSNGLTKDGSGTLVLSGTTNTYGGDTMLNLGTLQIADVGSLGTGNVTFGGGTLQYPAGSGTTTIDVSSKIPTVASGQVAVIDTDGNDVTFGTAIGGTGGLTKLGAGSLTLGAAIPSGTTTVSAGTLNVSSASGTITTLNVPTGGTVNLGTDAVVTTLNITGGTVHITGTNVQVGSLIATAGTLEAATNPLAVTTQATVAGVSLSLGGASSFTLSGANLIAPDSGNHRMVTATGGTLGFAATGLDVAIGIAAPGSNAAPTTATFGGSGVWTLNGGVVADLGNVYGKDNHAFHYIQIPAGDFDLMAHVTGTSNARAGLMVRDVLGSAPAPTPLPPNALPTAPSGTGNWVGIWNQVVASTMDGAVPNVQNLGATGNTPYLRITKAGNVITSYYSTDGVNYTMAQQRDYSSSTSGWGATTYVGLDLTNTSGTSVSGAFDNVNFMGTASMPDLSTTELDLSGGAKANVDCRVRLAKLTIDTVVQPDGAYTAVNTPGSISGSESIIIGDNSATVTLGDLSHTYTGGAKAATYSTTPTGLTVALTYNGSATEPINAGSYITRAAVVDPYYAGLTMGTLVIAKATATVTLGSLNQHYDGNPKPATATTTPSGLAVNFTYDGNGTAPSAMGSYAVVATVNDPNYTGSASGTLVIGAVATDYDTWAMAYLPADVTNPAGDNDGDGMTNLQEYAFGLNPTSGASCNPITQQLDQTTGVFKYTRRATPATTGLTYTVLTSSNLSTWTPDAGAAESTETNGEVQTVTFTLTGAPLTAPKLFVRVEATQP